VRKLDNCVKDVEDITRILVRNYDFAEERVRYLLDTRATRCNILEALDGYAESLTEKDNLLVLFSGHGELHNGIGAWIPVDARGFTDYLHVSTVWTSWGP